jgi:hypothetical protein
MPIPANQMVDWEVIVNGTAAAAGSNSRPVAIVFHFRRTTLTTAVNPANLKTAFVTAIATPIAAALNIRFTGQNVSVRCINDATYAPIFFTFTTPGVITGDSMSTTLSAYILLRTGLRGKSYRGSKHLFPLSESDTTVAGDDVLNAAALARMATIAAAILAGFTDSDGNVWISTVLSKVLSKLTKNPTTVTANPVTQTAVAKRVGTMRHRKVKQVY